MQMMVLRIVLAAAAVAGLVSVQDSAKAEWLTDKDKAFEEARRTGRPLFVVFR